MHKLLDRPSPSLCAVSSLAPAYLSVQAICLPGFVLTDCMHVPPHACCRIRCPPLVAAARLDADPRGVAAATVAAAAPTTAGNAAVRTRPAPTA